MIIDIILSSLLNGILFYLMYLGFIKHISGAEKVLLFYAWILIIGCFFLLFSPKQREKIIIFPWLNLFLDMFIASVFIWFGHWVTGLFWAIHLLLIDDKIIND